LNAIRPLRRDPRGPRTGASSLRPTGTHTADTAEAPRTRARCARSTDSRPCASAAEARKGRWPSWGAHSGGAVPQAIGALSGGLDPPCVATDLRRQGGPTGLAGIPRTRESQLRGPRTALALASRHVLVHGLVLPAVLPLAVDRQLGLAARLRAHTPWRVGLVRSWKVPDGRPPESVVRHAVSHPFLRAGCGLAAPQYPLRTASPPGSFPFPLPSRRSEMTGGSRRTPR